MARHVKPYDAQKVMDALTDFNTTSKHDPNRTTAQSVVQLAFKYKILTEEDAETFGVNKREFEQLMPNTGLGIDQESRTLLFNHIKDSARKCGATPPKEAKQRTKQSAAGFDEFYPT